MSIFTDFLEEEIILLVSLPYRVGVWMSQVDDDASTDRDDEREQRALEAVMKQIAADKKQTPFASAVVQETLTYPDHWAGWGQQIDTLMDDIAKATALIDDRLPQDNAQNYRKCLLTVASAVAHAYGEFEEAESEEKPSFFGNLMNKISDKVNVLSDDPDNMSPAEQDAMKKLRTALDA
ncbi:MAG: hypothetical protein AAF569_05270 [Pseudomonadota bacterium]